ncbi:MAG: hypothetical protein EA391_03920 [Balneolaceae bacterium]|nr:MAG: hypothetical protein EA391_03920 [Balneolaceae bacterium]
MISAAFTILFFTAGCTLFSSSDDDILTDFGPIDFTMTGELNDSINQDHSETRAEWMPIQSLDEVQARFFASNRDTVENEDIWQRYGLAVVRNSEWPATGTYGVTSLSDIRNNSSDQFFIRLSSLYRKYPLTGNESSMYLLDYSFIATDGTIKITASTNEFLRGEFSLTFMMSEKRSWDTIEEVVEGPRENALEIEGSFHLDLLKDRVSQLSMH